MATFGQGINPQLGAIDYSPILKGSVAGAEMAAKGGQMIGQGLANLGAQVGRGLEEYAKNKQERDQLVAGIETSAKDIGMAYTEWEQSTDPNKGEAPISKGAVEELTKLVASAPKASTGALKNSFSRLALVGQDVKGYKDRNYQAAIRKDALNQIAIRKNAEEKMSQIFAPTQDGPSQVQQAIGSGADFTQLGGLSYAPTEAPVGFNDVMRRATQLGVPLSAVLPALKAMTDQQQVDQARFGKPPTIPFQEQTAKRLIDALEARQGGKPATKQQVADIYSGVQRSGSMAGDPNEKATLELLVKELPAIGERADAALTLKPSVVSIMQKLRNGIKTGKIEGLKTDIIGFARSFGVPVDESQLGAQETIRAQMGQLMFEWLSKSRGSTSDRENILFALMGPEFSKSNAANDDLMELVQSRMDFDIELGSIYRNGMSKGDKIPTINGDLQDARERFSQKYDKKVNDLYNVYAKKDIMAKGVAEELKRRKGKGDTK